MESNNNLAFDSAHVPSFLGSFEKDSEKNNSFVTGYCNKPITKAEFNSVTKGNASTELFLMRKFTFE